jgi:hypothetical protein
MFKRISLIVIAFIFSFISLTTSPVIAASQWSDAGNGYKWRIDTPHGKANPKYHVHVNKGNKEVGSQNVDGTKSHGKTLNAVPKSVKKKIESHPKYKEAQNKQKKLNAATHKIKSKKLNLRKSVDFWVAVAIVVAATGTLFFPGDDFAAWANLLRATVR